MIFTDDPVRDAAAYDRECAEYLARLPKCCRCDNPIDDDGYYYDIDGDYYCKKCLNDKFRKDLADYGG